MNNCETWYEMVNETLTKITFPGWEWTVRYTAFGCLISASFDRPDANTGNMERGHTRWEFAEKDCAVDSIVKTAWVIVDLTTRHEAMEHFRYQGERIFDPHVSVESLVDLQQKGTATNA